MAFDSVSYVLSKGYTEDTCDGLGYLKGSPCTIKSTTETDEGIIIVFEWTGTSGATEKTTILIKNGLSGASIVSVDIDDDNYLICTLSDGTVTKSTNPIEITGTSGEDNKIESISVNGTEVIPDVNKNVDITIPDAPIKSITVNDTEVEPDEDGNVDITIADTNKIEIVKQNGTALEIDPTDKSVDVLADVNKIEVVKVNGAAVEIDTIDKSVNIEIPEVEVPIKSISLNDTLLEIDEDANVNIEADKNIIETVKVDGVALTVDEDDKSVNIELQDYAKTEEVEQYVDEQLYTTVITEAHYEITESTTDNALEVVADGTATDGQIDISSVTPLLDGVAVSEGDYVVWIESSETKNEKYVLSGTVYSKDKTDEKYVEHSDMTVLTSEQIEEMLGLSQEELEGLATILADEEVRIDKTYSSSKIYNELNRVLEEGKTYTLAEIAKSSGASYKIAISTTEMTSTKYIYLLANGDTYDMYICEEENSTPVKIGTTSVTLTDYYTKTECDERYVLATAFELLNNSIGDVNNLQTTSKIIVDAVNEVLASLGDITTLKTTAKDNIANAVNEVVDDLTETKEALGDVSALETTVKDNVVNAVNEVKKSIDEFETYVELTQAEYDALPDDDTGKLNGIEYRTTDTGKIYKNGMQYGGQEPISCTFEQYKQWKTEGTIDPDAEYIVSADAEGILLGAEDIGYNNAESGIQATTVQGAIDKVSEKVDGIISDTDLTSTTSTLSANKIRSAVVHSFNTQDGKVKYLKLKLDVNPISVVDIYGGKIEILGANNSSANPSYKTVKVVRHSYGNWDSYDATQIPSTLSTKIGSLYYYPTDNYYYLQLNNYAHFIVTGALTKPETVTDLPTEISAMTLIPESSWGRINDSVTDTTTTWSSSKIASEIGAKVTKTKYRGSRSIDISTGDKLTLIYSSEYASQAGCYMLLSNFNTEPLLIELGRNDIGQFKLTAKHKSQNVDTITGTTAGDE